MLTPTSYRWLSAAAEPLVRAKLRQRTSIGKENPARLAERWGHAGAARPPGPLIWVHAVSVGETISILPLISRLVEDRPEISVLLTTATTTSAQMVEGRLPRRCMHQFVPVDVPRAVDRFLAHWQPDIGIFVESELWPNLVLTAARRGVPLAMVNGRMTEPTWRRWHRTPRLIAAVLASYALMLARSEADATRLGGLGATDVRCIGDLKYAGPALEVDAIAEAALRGWIGERRLWLAASTHPGEEEIVAAAHGKLKASRPGLLTLIAPRHPERGAEIANALEAAGWTVARRSQGAPVTSATDIYLADTLGELGLFYRIAEIVFVGGSLTSIGGHNLLEAARLDCAILHGPHMTNFEDMTREFAHAGAAVTVADGDELATVIGTLLADSEARRSQTMAARAVAEAKAGVLDAVLDALGPMLDQALDGTQPHAGA